MSIKATQSTIQACITWPKTFGKGKVEWARTCLDVGFKPWKLSTQMKTRFASKAVMFQ
jgi:hypothetical protein